jgi:hypothetical protein
MSNNVIAFPEPAALSPKRRKPTVRASNSRMSRVELEQEPERPACDEGELTVTCQNKRLRDARREVWREAESIREYWKARLEMESAISCAQRHELPEAITILRTIRMNAGRCLQTGAKPSRNSCLRPRRIQGRSPGKKRPWPPTNMNSPM